MFQTTPPVKPLCRLPHWHHLHNICWPDWPQLGCSLLTTDGSWSTEWIQKTVTLQWCHQDVVQETPLSCSLCLLNAFLLQLNVHLQAISERWSSYYFSLAFNIFYLFLVIAVQLSLWCFNCKSNEVLSFSAVQWQIDWFTYFSSWQSQISRIQSPLFLHSWYSWSRAAIVMFSILNSALSGQT